MSNPLPGGFAGINADPEQALARIDEWANAAAVKAEKYQEVARRTEEMRLTATSPRGEVKATVRSDGSLTDLEFSSRARNIPLPELSALILRTMRQAQAGIAGQVNEVLTEQLGDQDPQTKAMMVDELRSRFPDPEADEEPPTAEASPPPPPAAPPGQPQPPRPARRRDDDTPEGQDGENSPW
ncbi:YbaB/EbfC family nucleoid-associated protein [Amycolatopsis suaedae]|uniref:YbaB/EbfC family DNA-binding protein n=1 Tax=Amycolatopsis suaedae TaxID=2510978 RepID=A0A4Q7J7C4_9PSEU|nr:YbaB/EbfC family nucleoid-associated protein [Amycolatopsis suaedae]RZQ61924.1 YbaB/EbfC family DNA-binding protein [Amycolatopsis suaedae]